jgi:HAD superfamily hydrolase (TIGR01484 family)
MRPFAEFPAAALAEIRYVLTDIDDTLTHQGRLPGHAYLAIERLQKAGVKVIPVTAGSSGWCDLIARMWPVEAVIGENGGLYFCRTLKRSTIIRRYWSSDIERQEHCSRLRALAEQILVSVPGSALAPDQHYRETTLALTSHDGAFPERQAADRIVSLLREAGARTTTNSMWVLAWAGDFDKLAMTRRMMANTFGVDIEAERQTFLYVGDSLNDEPMFSFFTNSVGVSTVPQFLDRMSVPPLWVTRGPGGAGFVEIADAILHE